MRAKRKCIYEQGSCLYPGGTFAVRYDRHAAAVSLKVALAVGESAINNGVNRRCAFSNFQHENDPVRLQELIRRMRWQPHYLPLVAM